LNAIVLLVRHGETLWNEMRLLQGRTDVSLSDAGREQARALSVALSSIPLSSIYCSPLSRARETAEILAMPRRLTPRVEAGFAEMSFGEWEGKSHSTLSKEFPEQYQRWLVDPSQVELPRAEKLVDVQARVRRGFERIVESSDGGVVAIVGHGGVNRALLLSLLHAEARAFWKLRQDLACVNLIEVFEGIPRLALANSTTHLKADYCQLVKEAATRARISI